MASLLVHSGVALLASIPRTAGFPGTGRGPGALSGRGEGEAGASEPHFQVAIREGIPSAPSRSEGEEGDRTKGIPDDSSPVELPERPETPLDLFRPTPSAESREDEAAPLERSIARRSRSAFDRLPPAEAARLPEGAISGPEHPRPPASGRGASGSGKGTGGSGDASLVAIYTPKPAYPPVARRKGLQGVVVLDLTIEPGGTVSTVTLVESSGSESLDQAALEKMKEWKYERKPRESPAGALVQRVRCVFRLDP